MQHVCGAWGVWHGVGIDQAHQLLDTHCIQGYCLQLETHMEHVTDEP
jgi:hypothetical protein